MRVFGFAGAGALATIAVSWCCAIFAVPDQWESRAFGDHEKPRWRGRVRAAEKGFLWWSGMSRGSGWRRGQFHWFYHEDVPLLPGQTQRTTKVDFVEAGWPMPAMYGAFPHEPDAVDLRRTAIHFDRGASGTQDDVILPLVPILPEFAMEAAGAGALFWVLSLALRRTRRAIRRRRGRCPECAYDLRGGRTGSPTSPLGCPECGWNRSDD